MFKMFYKNFQVKKLVITKIIILPVLLLVYSCGFQNNSRHNTLWIISAPCGNEVTKINKYGKTVIPNGRYITPVGKNIITAPHPYGLTLSPDGNIAITANSGIKPLSITIISDILSQNPKVRQIPPGPNTDKGVLASVFMGLAISPDNRTVYVSGGQENLIYIFDIISGKRKGIIDCSDVAGNVDYSNSYIGDLKLSRDGKTLYAVDQIGFRIVIVNTKTRKLKCSVPVGRYPFGICLSPDEKRAYVANVGMFEYSMIKNKRGKNSKVKSINFPPFSYGSEEMKEGIHA